MKELVSCLGVIYASEVVEQAGASKLVLSKAPRFVFEIVVPANVLEWFVAAKDSNGVELWSDWADYYPLKSETREELQSQMADDIERFAAVLVSSDVRKTSVMEWMRDDVWCQIALAAI